MGRWRASPVAAEANEHEHQHAARCIAIEAETYHTGEQWAFAASATDASASSVFWPGCVDGFDGEQCSAAVGSNTASEA